MKVAIVTGTRPEIIKLAPLIKELKGNSSVIFTGQHYDFELGMRFFKELGLPLPDYKLRISRQSPAIQIGEIISKLHHVFSEIKPDTVSVQGDTNTALAGAICALKMNIPINHVESGLRSFDWRMPEEHNRIEIDHIAELLFASTQNSKKNLLNEMVHGRIFVTGNTAMDSIKQYIGLAEKKSSLETGLDDFILFTMHRAENVDNETVMRNVISAMIDIKQRVIFPVHPRTRKRLHQFNLLNKINENKNINLIDSVGYFDVLKLMKNSMFIVSDSGGMQEEATSPLIRKKVLVVRKTTDRPESVKNGFSQVVGTSKKRILKAMKQTIRNPKVVNRPSPYGNGESSKKIISLLKRFFS